ncbi:MAG: hypothetical protein RL115_1192 [Bacteroidota bacterium]|jgi:hypothetical protein
METVDCIAVQQSPVFINVLGSVGDTLLDTDAAFTDRMVFFQTNKDYQNNSWTVGADPRSFNKY